MTLRFSLIIILCCLSLVVYSQAPDKWTYTGFDLMAYKGDLSGYKGYRAGFHLGLQFNKKHRFNGAITLGLGTVTGEDRNFTPNHQFSSVNRFVKTNIFLINYDLRYNFIKNESWILYISQGVGFMLFTPKDQFNDNLEDQPHTRAEGESYRNSALALPTKIGATYILKNNFGMGVQAGFINPLTDYIDNISDLGDSGNDNLLMARLSLWIPF